MCVQYHSPSGVFLDTKCPSYVLTVHTVYTVYTVYSVYTVYTVYSVYTVYTVYTVCAMRMYKCISVACTDLQCVWYCCTVVQSGKISLFSIPV